MLSDDQQNSIMDMLRSIAVFDPKSIKVQEEGTDVLVTFNLEDGKLGRKQQIMYGSWMEKDGKWQYGWRIIDYAKEKLN